MAGKETPTSPVRPLCTLALNSCFRIKYLGPQCYVQAEHSQNAKKRKKEKEEKKKRSRVQSSLVLSLKGKWEGREKRVKSERERKATTCMGGSEPRLFYFCKLLNFPLPWFPIWKNGNVTCKALIFEERKNVCKILSHCLAHYNKLNNGNYY